METLGLMGGFDWDIIVIAFSPLIILRDLSAELLHVLMLSTSSAAQVLFVLRLVDCL